MQKLAFSTSREIGEGHYGMYYITKYRAKELVSKHFGNFESDIDDEGVASALSVIFGIDLKVRTEKKIFSQDCGQIVLIFYFNGNKEELKYLTIEEIEEIGYGFYELHRVD